MDHESPQKRKIKSIQVTFDIIETLDERVKAGVSELADACNVTKSTAHYHLRTLNELGYVVRDSDGTYELGLRFLRLGRRVQVRQPLYALAKPEIDELIADIGERAQLMVREGDLGAHIYRAVSDRAINTDSDIGSHVHLHATAAGKAYLAELPPDEVESIIQNEGLPRFTPNTITTREGLFDNLRLVREQRHAFNMEENLEGLRAVGVAIKRDNTRDVLGALSVSGPTTRMAGQFLTEDVPSKLKEVAKIIGIKATYQQI